MVDTGIWPESLSFSDRTGPDGNPSKGKLVYQQIPGWHGKCTPGEAFNASMCNQKSSAPSTSMRAGAATPARCRAARGSSPPSATTTATAPTPPPRPAATTACPRRPGGRVRHHQRHGAARPHRHVQGAVGSRSRTGSGYNLRPHRGHRPGRRGRRGRHQLLDQRLPDQLPRPGRDLLHVRGRGRHLRGRVGGQQRPDHLDGGPSRPWTTTVAAGTHNRSGAGSVTLGNGVTYPARRVATAVGAPIIDSTAAGAARRRPDASPSATRGQRRRRPRPGKVAGKIVVCDRGSPPASTRALPSWKPAAWAWSWSTRPTARSMPTSIRPDRSSQPRGSHGSQGLRGHAGATATINQATIVYNGPAPFTASFSSRGPLLASARPPQARPDGPRPGHPGRGRAARQQRSRLRPLQRHLDVEPARGRPGGPAQETSIPTGRR